MRVLPGAMRGAPGLTNYLGTDDRRWVYDIMSYHVPPWTWVSSFTYCGLLQGVLDILHLRSTRLWNAGLHPLDRPRTI